MKRSMPLTKRLVLVRPYFMVNCAHPDHFSNVLENAEWARRIRGIRCNASRKSHAELDQSETLDDGDPIDVLICNTRPLVPGCVINVRPIGVMIMEDDGGKDEKILAVPVPKLTRRYDKVHNYTDLPEITLKQIEHFFEHYKDLEPNKWVKVDEWADAAEAERLVGEAFARFEEHDAQTKTQGEGEAPNTL